MMKNMVELTVCVVILLEYFCHLTCSRADDQPPVYSCRRTENAVDVDLARHPQGIIRSPQRSFNLQCIWNFPRTVIIRVKTFIFQQPNFNNECPSYLKIRLWYKDSSYVYCGNELAKNKDHVYVKSILFDNPTTFYPKFELHYEVVTVFPCALGNVVIQTPSYPEGEIISPYYPNQYGHNMSCSWAIQGKDVLLRVLAFDLEQRNEDKCYDFVFFNTHSDPQQYCGRELRPGTSFVLADSLNLYFASDHSATSVGFRFTYKVLPVFACRKEGETGHRVDTTIHPYGVGEGFHAVASSGNFPGCSWEFRQLVRIFVRELEVPASNSSKCVITVDSPAFRDIRCVDRSENIILPVKSVRFDPQRLPTAARFRFFYTNNLNAPESSFHFDDVRRHTSSTPATKSPTTAIRSTQSTTSVRMSVSTPVRDPVDSVEPFSVTSPSEEVTTKEENITTVEVGFADEVSGKWNKTVLLSVGFLAGFCVVVVIIIIALYCINQKRKRRNIVNNEQEKFELDASNAVSRGTEDNNIDVKDGSHTYAVAEYEYCDIGNQDAAGEESLVYNEIYNATDSSEREMISNEIYESDLPVSANPDSDIYEDADYEMIK